MLNKHKLPHKIAVGYQKLKPRPFSMVVNINHGLKKIDLPGLKLGQSKTSTQTVSPIGGEWPNA
jgi:hypothetical protein